MAADDSCMWRSTFHGALRTQIVDFHNSVTPAPAGASVSRQEQALRSVLEIFEGLNRPIYHLIGNHCLYCHQRPVLNRELGIDLFQDAAPHSYYAVTPAQGWRFVVLDGYDVSFLGWPPGHPLHERAVALLEARNPNKVGVYKSMLFSRSSCFKF